MSLTDYIKVFPKGAGYRCLECGHLFERGEEKRWTEPHGELMTGCPLCLGSFKETVSCTNCGSAQLDDELYDGWCAECLRDAVTYDAFWEYLNEDEERLAHFMFECCLDSTPPAQLSESLNVAQEVLYRIWIVSDLCKNTTHFLEICKRYVMEDDGEFGRLDYAEWLNRRR